MVMFCKKKKKKPFSYERCTEVFTNEMIHSPECILEFSSKEMKEREKRWETWVWRWRINEIKLAKCKKIKGMLKGGLKEFNIMLDIKIANYYLSFQSP